MWARQRGGSGAFGNSLAASCLLRAVTSRPRSVANLLQSQLHAFKRISSSLPVNVSENNRFQPLAG